MARMQSRTQQKHNSSKIAFWIAMAALILVIGLSIYVFCTRNVARNRQTQRSVPTKNTSSRSLSPTPLQTTNNRLQTIRYVHDGDTIYTRDFKPAVRLIGIDAPEMAGSYRCGKDAKCDAINEECGASEAKEKLKELVLNEEVWLVEDIQTDSTDKYDRLLRYVFVRRDRSDDLSDPAEGWEPREGLRPSPTMINEMPCVTENESCLDLSLALIQSGLAREAGFGNSYEKQKTYKEAELEAKRKKLGIWGMCE